MKKTLVVALAVVSISASATVAMAGKDAGTGINGSWHDLNSALNADHGYKGDTWGRSCAFCHTPHNAPKTEAKSGVAGDTLSPLWNHKDNALLFPQPYVWISPANTQIGINKDDPLVGPSRLCMACHDGTTAVDSHGTAGFIDNGTQMKNVAKATYDDPVNNTKVKRYIDDLTVTHPIGFLYEDAYFVRGAKELVPSNTGFIVGAVPSTDAFNTNNRTGLSYTSKKIADTLYNGYMTCASCHDVHNTLNVTNAKKEYNYFLYAQQEGSAICLSCHVK